MTFQFSDVVVAKKLHHRRPQTAAQIAHEILETSPEHGHGIPAKMGDKLGDKTGDNREADTASQPRWETRPETRGGQDQRSGHSIPAKANRP